jgi:hypothetical protein
VVENRLAQAARCGHSRAGSARRPHAAAWRCAADRGRAAHPEGQLRPLKSFAPVSVFEPALLLAVNGNNPVKTLLELVAHGKGRKLNYGSGGVG